MENYELIDMWIALVKENIEVDIDELLQEYIQVFNDNDNVLNELSEEDLIFTFYEYLSEVYSIGEG